MGLALARQNHTPDQIIKTLGVAELHDWLAPESKSTQFYLVCWTLLLRTTLGTMLARNGIAPQVAKQVMRYSDYRATMKSYTALELDDSRQAVASLKSFASANRVDGPGFLRAPSPAGPPRSGARRVQLRAIRCNPSGLPKMLRGGKCIR